MSKINRKVLYKLYTSNLHEEKLEEMKGVPWAIGRNADKDVDVKVDVPGQGESLKEVPTSKEKEAWRVFHIRQNDVKKHKETPGCVACTNLLEGRASVGKHTK